MFQEWLKRYEKIKQENNEQEIDYCPTCGRKLTNLADKPIQKIKSILEIQERISQDIESGII